MIEIQQIDTLHEQPVHKITLTNPHGMQVSSVTYGCIITSILTPDRHGALENVVCSFPQVTKYTQHAGYFGAAIGPFAGRLENAETQLTVQPATRANEGQHLLHGGRDGFHQKHWTYETGENDLGQYVTYTINEPVEGFTTALKMAITYTLTKDNTLLIDYLGTASGDTLLNATNHSYFNLSGNLQRTIADHTLQFASEQMLYLDEQGLPIPLWQQVSTSPFDFNAAKTIQDVMDTTHPQIQLAGGGIDHPFLLADKKMILSDAGSGRQLTITTDQLAVVVYTGSKIGSGYDFTEAPAKNFLGICLEVQNVPNSVKHAHLPSSVLREGAVYKQHTAYQFTTID